MIELQSAITVSEAIFALLIASAVFKSINTALNCYLVSAFVALLLR